MFRGYLSPNWLMFFAYIHYPKTPGVKATPRRGINRAGNVTLQDHPLLFLVRVQHGDGRHERLSVRMERVGQKFLIRGQFDDLP